MLCSTLILYCWCSI